MKITKSLIALALIPALMPFQAFAQEKSAEQSTDTNSNTAETSSLSAKAGELGNKLWESAKNQLKNAKIKTHLNLPTVEIAKGLTIGGGYGVESSPSIAGKYSGIDVWDVNLAAYPQLFGITMPEGVGAGITLSRQVTYIQQFKSQKESLLRVPYDPITKLPLNSKMFFEKRKNLFTGEIEPVLKANDFIAYRAPMTFALGKSFSRIAAGHLGLSAGLNYTITGEFDVHVFVMDNNQIRVKILAAKSTSKGASVGISLLGFSAIGGLIVDKLINAQLLEFYFNKTNSDLFIADYIFNMNQEEPKALYDKVIGSKLHTFSMAAIKEQILTSNPFASDGATRDRMLANLDELNETSNADQDKPYSERRILKLLNAHNESETFGHGIRLNLLKILKFESSQSKVGSKITIYANRDNSVKAQFKLDGYNVTNSFEIVPALNIWGDKSSTSNTLLTQVDASGAPIEFMGLQNTKMREDFNLKKAEFDGLMARISRILPATIVDKLEKPNWDFGAKDKVYMAHVEQDITFSSDLFKMKVDIKQETIREALLNILANYGQLKSRPMGSDQNSGGGERDPRMEAFNARRYAEAYGYSVEKLFGGEKRVSIDWEMHLIPQKLAIALDSRYSFADRYAEFSYLYEKVPLFSEISNVLLLKLLPEADLEKVVLVRIVMSAKGQKTLITDYPTTESFNTGNLFREILAQNAFMNDKSFNLRHYLKEDGNQYSIDEIMVQKGK